MRRNGSRIAGARLEQIFMMAKQMVEDSPVGKRICAGTMLTGGTALMPGIAALISSSWQSRAAANAPRFAA